MSKPRILIGDDEKNILKVLESRLKAGGFDVIKASSGDEALEKIKKEKPDLVILDLGMPGLNGYQVCRELKKTDEFKQMPIIILSAWVREKQGEDTALADLYLTKPFRPEELISQVRWLLENRGHLPKPAVS